MLPRVGQVKTAPRPPEAWERSSWGGREGFGGDRDSPELGHVEREADLLTSGARLWQPRHSGGASPRRGCAGKGPSAAPETLPLHPSPDSEEAPSAGPGAPSSHPPSPQSTESVPGANAQGLAPSLYHLYSEGAQQRPGPSCPAWEHSV